YEATLKIQSLDSDIVNQNLAIEKQKNNLAQTLRLINDLDEISPFDLLMAQGDFSDFLNQIQYASNLQNGIQQKLTAIRALKAQLETQKTESETQKTALENLKNQLRGKSVALDNQKDEQQDLLQTTKNQEKQYQATLTTLQKQREQIEDEIFVAEQKLRLAINQNSITAGQGALMWPIGKSSDLTQNYGCIVSSFARKSYPACNEGKGNGGFHNGLDIDGNLGDVVRAGRDGTVSGVGNLGKYSYGRWITITHNNGLTTLYGHLSSQIATNGQKVQAGDIIGYMGSTGYSTGSHLHFSVYATNTFSIQQKWYGPVPLGGSLNPLLYL
ncbi:MAG: peptidoglycan DD-metalloendopeptidase family protein, partial [Patescibacteria group bacterium]